MSVLPFINGHIIEDDSFVVEDLRSCVICDQGARCHVPLGEQTVSVNFWDSLNEAILVYVALSAVFKLIPKKN